MSLRKIVFGFAALAMIFSVATSVSAQVDPALLSLLSSLTPAQLTALLQTGGVSGSTTGTSACNFTRDLTVGSTGDDVTCLQNALITKGMLNIPSATGYFGNLTKNAVASWQASAGVTPTLGYFGPKSRAAFVAMGGGSVTPPPMTGALCPNGMTLASNCSVAPGAVAPALCPNGMTLVSNCTVAPGGTVPGPVVIGGASDGVLVSGTISLESTPSNGTDVKKGDVNMPIAKWKIKVSGSDGVLKQFGIQTTNRSWLYWSSARLVDSTGAVIAEKTNLSASDFSEVTAGSDYRLIFGNLNKGLAKGVDNFVTLQVSTYSSTDRTAASGLVVSQVSNSVVVGDANDNYTYSDGDISDRTWDFIAATAGNIVPSISVTSPLTRSVKVSNTGTTPNVDLLTFNMKAENRDAKVESLTFTINTSGSTAGATANLSGANAPLATSLFNSIDLYDGSTLIASGSVGSSTTFTSLSINIPLGTTKTLTLKAVAADSDSYALGVSASTTLAASTSGISGVDSNFDSLTVSGGTVTSNNTIFNTATANVASISTSIQPIENVADQVGVTFKFSIAASGGAVYVSKTPATALATSSPSAYSAGNGTSTLTTISVGGSTNSDASTYWTIDDGITREFIYTGSMNNDGINSSSTAASVGLVSGFSAGVKEFKITNLYWDDDTSGLQEFNINNGLENLRVYPYLTN